MRIGLRLSLTLFTVLNILSHEAQAKELEVLHWWTSGSESLSMNILKERFESTGNVWKNSPITGGSGVELTRALKARVGTGTPPSVVQIKTGAIKEWGDMGAFEDMSALAKEMNWKTIMPESLNNALKYKGKYVAVPVNIHRHNWLWVNKKVFEKAGAKIPTTLDEFFDAADKIKKVGLIPIAHGGEDWQDATLFEDIVMAVGGAEFHQKALVDLDPTALGGPTMIKVFDTMRRISTYLQPDRKGLAWDKATQMLIDDKAGMQFMGDWAKGEFLVKGKKPGKDFACVPAPGTDGQFLYLSDLFGMFKTQKSSLEEQKTLVKLVLDPKFQIEFNKKKGSIPVRTDIAMTEFDDCAKASQQNFIAASRSIKLQPSLTHGMVAHADLQNAIVKVVATHLNMPAVSSEYAAKKLVSALRESTM